MRWVPSLALHSERATTCLPMKLGRLVSGDDALFLLLPLTLHYFSSMRYRQPLPSKLPDTPRKILITITVKTVI